MSKSRDAMNSKNYELAKIYTENLGIWCLPRKHGEKIPAVSWRNRDITITDYDVWHNEGLWHGGIVGVLDRPTKDDNYIVVVDFDGIGGTRLYSTIIPIESRDTLTIETPSGGIHAYYVSPVPVTGTTRIVDSTELIDIPGAIDIRSAGNIVVMPDANNAFYKFIHPSTLSNPYDIATSDVEIADIPAWLKLLILYQKRVARLPKDAFTSIREYWTLDANFGMRQTGRCNNTRFAISCGLCQIFQINPNENLSIIEEWGSYHGWDNDDWDESNADLVERIYSEYAINDSCDAEIFDYIRHGSRARINVSNKSSKTSISITEADIGKEFAELHSDDIRFCVDSNKFYVYDENHGIWRQDISTQIIGEKFIEFIDKKIDDARVDLDEAMDDNRRAAIERRISELTKFKSHRKLTSTIQMAPITTQKIRCMEGDFDNDIYKLNLLNGFYDLEIDKFVANEDTRRDSMFRKSAKVIYDEDARCPKFEEFLSVCLGHHPDAEAIIEFIRAMMGYILSGDISHESLFILFGTGRNGKTTLIKILELLLGDYATNLPENFISREKFSTHPAELLTIEGARLAIAEELETTRLNLRRLKLLASQGATIQARGMRENFREIPVQAKILATTNSVPYIDSRSLGVIRRIFVIPFTADIAKILQARGKPIDRNFAENVVNSEGPGILNWALEGWRQVRDHGLPIVESITATTDEIISTSDPISDWLATSCIIDDDAKTPRKILYDKFIEDTGSKISSGAFYRMLLERGFTQGKNHGIRYIAGLRIADGFEIRYSDDDNVDVVDSVRNAIGAIEHIIDDVDVQTENDEFDEFDDLF